jgi:hypothetical protein
MWACTALCAPTADAERSAAPPWRAPIRQDRCIPFLRLNSGLCRSRCAGPARRPRAVAAGAGGRRRRQRSPGRTAACPGGPGGGRAPGYPPGTAGPATGADRAAVHGRWFALLLLAAAADAPAAAAGGGVHAGGTAGRPAATPLAGTRGLWSRPGGGGLRPAAPPGRRPGDGKPQRYGLVPGGAAGLDHLLGYRRSGAALPALPRSQR